GRAWTLRSLLPGLASQNAFTATNPGQIYLTTNVFTDKLSRRREVRAGLGGAIQMRFLDVTNGANSFVYVYSPTVNTLRQFLTGQVYPVVIGEKGTILQYDPDNDGFKSIASPTTVNLNFGAVSGLNQVLYGANGLVMTANSGYATNWFVRTTGTANNINAMGTAVNGFLLAVGDNGTILASADNGTNWSSRTSGVTNRLVALATDSTASATVVYPEGAAFVLMSTNNGINWFQVAAAGPLKVGPGGAVDGGYTVTVSKGSGLSGDQLYSPVMYFTPPALPNWRCGAYGNGRYLVISDSGATVVSTNGINWLAGTNPAANPRALTYGQGMFLLVGTSGFVAGSADGVFWNVLNPSVTNLDFLSVAYGNGRFVAVGAGGTLFSSTNGINWDNFSFNNAGGALYGVAFNGTVFSVYGNALGGATIGRYSADGVTWSTYSPPSSMTTLLGAGNGRFVGSGNNLVFLSTNGVNWTTIAPPGVNFNGYGVAYGGGRYVITGPKYSSFDNGSPVLNSPDGTNWYREILPYYVAGASGVLAANGKFLLLGINGALLTEDYLETNTPPQITGQPAPANVVTNPGATFSLSGSATGAGTLTYRWLKNGVALFDGAGVSGTTTPTLTFSSVDFSAAGYYQLTVQNNGGSDISQSAWVTITNDAPYIIQQPLSATVTNLTRTNFVVVVAGALPMTFQWYQNGLIVTNAGNLTGANDSLLSLKPVTRTNEGDYLVVVSNAFGVVTSSIAHLAVLRPPTILQVTMGVAPASPTNFTVPVVEVYPGQSLNLAATVDGTAALNYQWLSNGVTAVAGATNSNFALTNLQAPGVYTYAVQITNLYGSTAYSTQFSVVGPGARRLDAINFTNNALSDIAALPDGTFLTGGYMTINNSNCLYRFGLPSLSGATFTNFMAAGNYLPDGVRTMAVMNDGGAFIGGSFVVYIGGVGYTNLVHLLANGQFDAGFRYTNSEPVQKLVVIPGGGKVLALRAPDIAGVSYVVRYNADGTVDGSFNKLTSATTGFWGLGVQSSGAIWIGASTVGLEKANADGTGLTVVTNSSAGKIFVTPDDRVYFTPGPVGANTVYTYRVNNTNGLVETNFSLALGGNIRSIVGLPNGKLLVAGVSLFTLYNLDGTLAGGQYTGQFTYQNALNSGETANAVLPLADGTGLVALNVSPYLRRVQLYMPTVGFVTLPLAQAVNRGSNVTFTALATASGAVTYQWRFNGTNLTGATGASLTLTNVTDGAAGL
ncbi:MAG TPA: immunoglobulin domain-containing protein, partial [Verrucomicrobiae bacterium]